MVYAINDQQELENLLAKRELVLLLIYNSQTPIGRYASGLADNMATLIEPGISLAKADVGTNSLLASEYSIAESTPIFRLYYRSKLIWEQVGLFMSYGSDKYAIRRGILRALRKKGITPRSLGIRLATPFEE